MKRASTRLLVPQLVWCLFTLGCDSDPPQRKQQGGDNPIVASRPGIVQVGGPNDSVIDEATACSRFKSALESNIERLKCTNLAVEECPSLVHPLVDLPCVMYSEPSVSECEEIFDDAKNCDGLAPGACVLSAILDPTDAEGLPLECSERDSTGPDGSGFSPVDAAFDAAHGDAASGLTSEDSAVSRPDGGDGAANASTDASMSDEATAEAVASMGNEASTQNSVSEATPDANPPDANLPDANL
jgi:hypothetical protein